MCTRILAALDGRPISNPGFNEAIELAKERGADGGCLTRVKCSKAPGSGV